MFWLKKCPRCGGDLYDNEDAYGLYIACAQCGFQKDVPEGLRNLPHLYLHHPGMDEAVPVRRAKVGAGRRPRV